MKRLGIVFVLTVQGIGAVSNLRYWGDHAAICMSLWPDRAPIKVQSRNEFVDGGSALIDWVVRQHEHERVSYENVPGQENAHSSSQKNTASPTDLNDPWHSRSLLWSEPNARTSCLGSAGERPPWERRVSKGPRPFGAGIGKGRAKGPCRHARPGQHQRGMPQKSTNIKTAAVFKNVLQQNSCILQVKSLYTNYCTQLDNRTLTRNDYQIIDKRVRALKTTLDHPNQVQERNIKLSAQERAELLKSGVSAAALASLRGSAAQRELHEEYASVFEQWAQKSHEIRRSMVQEHISHIALQFADLADEFNRSNNLTGGYAMADVMHAAWGSVQELFVFAKATAQVDYEILSILGTSALDGAICAGCSTAQMIAHPLATLKNLGTTIARVAYTANILLGDDKQRIAQTHAELFTMLKATANELLARAKSQHPLMTVSDSVSGGTQFVAEGVLASKCLTLSAGVLDKSAQALKKLPALAKTAGTKIRLPLTGPQRELALAHAQASIGEAVIEEMKRAQTSISEARRSQIVAAGEEGRRRVPEKPSVTTAFPGPLPAPGTQQLLKVFALPEQQRAAIIARYGKPIPDGGSVCFKQPLHLIAIDVRKIDQKTGIVKEWKGFHHDYLNTLERNNIVKIASRHDFGGGFYEAIVEYGAQLPKKKSFFPAEWPPEKVCEKVLEAYGNVIETSLTNSGGQKIIGWLEREQKAIEIIMDKNRNIITAYPKLLYEGSK